MFEISKTTPGDWGMKFVPREGIRPGNPLCLPRNVFFLWGKKPPAERRAVALKAAGRARDSSPTNALPRRVSCERENPQCPAAQLAAAARPQGIVGKAGLPRKEPPSRASHSAPGPRVKPLRPAKEPGCLAHATTGWSRRPENCCFLSCASGDFAATMVTLSDYPITRFTFFVLKGGCYYVSCTS